MQNQNLKTKKIIVCYVRHGQTFDNLNKIHAGHQPGKLTPTGVNQAHQTGQSLKNANFDFIYVSDLGRTKETYEGIIHTATHLSSIQPTYLQLIRQKSCGVLLGKSSDLWDQNAIREGIPIRLYKCDEGQSWSEVYMRCHKFVHYLIKKHLGKQKQAGFGQDDVNDNESCCIRILVVTHGGFIMQTHNVMNKIKTGKQPLYLNDTKNCSFHQFQIEYHGENYDQIDDSLVGVEILKKNVTQY